MGRQSQHQKYLSTTTAALFAGILSITLVRVPSCTNAASSSVSPYIPQRHFLVNSSGSGTVFEPRDDMGGSTYSVPAVSSSFGSSGGGYSMGGGGGYDKGGGSYGVPTMPSPSVYKYQIYPSPAMQMQSYGWGGDDEDDVGGGGFPKELIGLLGLKGLKGWKGLKGVLGLLKLLLLLKKLLGIPLLPILLPIFLPLLLGKLALLVLPLLLILLLPVPIAVIPATPPPMGKKLLGNQGEQSLKQYVQDKMNSAMPNLHEDISHIVEKIKGLSADMSWGKLLQEKLETRGKARGSNFRSSNKQKSDLGDVTIKSKVGDDVAS